MVRLWQRSRAATTWLGLAGLLTFPVAAGLLGLLYLATHPSRGAIGFTGEVGALVVVAILLGLCLLTAAVHEFVHMIAMRLVGHRPRLRLDTLPYPRLATDAGEAPFTRSAFAVVCLAPVVLITTALVIWIGVGPYSGWLIVPAAFQLTASKMDVAYSLVAWRAPRGTLFRVVDDGLEMTDPEDYEIP